MDIYIYTEDASYQEMMLYILLLVQTGASNFVRGILIWRCGTFEKFTRHSNIIFGYYCSAADHIHFPFLFVVAFYKYN